MSTPMSDEDRLQEMLDRWEAATEEGRTVSAHELCPDRPDLLAELEQRIARLNLMSPFERTSPGETGHAPGDLPLFTHDRYHLLERLGGGSEGTVFRAHDPRLNRDVAIKIPTFDPDRLLREARLLARLEHPNILKVFDSGHDARGTPYIVVELMAQPSLEGCAAATPGGRVPAKRVIAWTTQIAAALHELHLAGLAHRDVKPDNILVDRTGNAVLADLGIAIEVSSQSAGLSAGSPAYKSPEQVRGEPLDLRSDVHALAVVVHRLLCGRLPLTDPSDADLTRREILAGLDRRVSPGVPPRLRPPLTKALSLSPADRHDCAPDFARDLERAWRASRAGRWAAIAVLATIALVALAGWRLRRQHLATMESIERQTDEARRSLGEGLRIFDDSRRRLDEVRAMSKRIVDEARRDSQHRSGSVEKEPQQHEP
jgi:hypothetical protein